MTSVVLSADDDNAEKARLVGQTVVEYELKSKVTRKVGYAKSKDERFIL